MATKKKRNLLSEIKQGIQDIKAHQAGKTTLRTHEMKPQAKIKTMTEKNSAKK